MIWHLTWHSQFLSVCQRKHSYFIITSENIALTFENYEQCFFYEILILIKSKNINVFCFQIITNQINHHYLFQ